MRAELPRLSLPGILPVVQSVIKSRRTVLR